MPSIAGITEVTGLGLAEVKTQKEAAEAENEVADLKTRMAELKKVYNVRGGLT